MLEQAHNRGNEMIQVEISTDRVKIVGHAGCGTVGNDLVCAAVSMLWYTLIGKLEKDNVTFRYVEDEGYCEMWMKQKDNKDVGIVLDTIMCGLDLLQQNYPKNIFVKKL